MSGGRVPGLSAGGGAWILSSDQVVQRHHVDIADGGPMSEGSPVAPSCKMNLSGPRQSRRRERGKGGEADPIALRTIICAR